MERIEIQLKDDLLGRSSDATFLTNYLISQSQKVTKKSFVVNVNAKWGYGKTFLITGWVKELKKQKICALYFDAWKNDFSNDPLLSLINELATEFKSQRNRGDELALDKAMKALVGISKKIAPISRELVLKVISKKAADILIDKFDGLESFDDLSADQEESVRKAVSLLTDSASKELTRSFQIKKSAVATFKSELSKYVTGLVKGRHKKNQIVFIFIDELDRCRPTFSIEILESVKHFFEIDKIVFVVATDTEQLRHSINSVYGVGFDSAGYLRRFFDVEYRLSQPSMNAFIGRLYGKLDAVLLENSVPSCIISPEHVIELIVQSFNLAPRDCEKLFVVLGGILDSKSLEGRTIHLIPMVVLIIIFYLDIDSFYSLESAKEQSNNIATFKNLTDIGKYNPAFNIVWNTMRSRNGFDPKTIKLDLVIKFYFEKSLLTRDQLNAIGQNPDPDWEPMEEALDLLRDPSGGSIGEKSNHGIDRYYNIISLAGNMRG
jgi:hypothetical protein